MAITTSGIGSGLDVENIVSRLMEVERQPLTRLQTSEAGVQAEISGVASLRGILGDLQDAVGTLADPATFTASKPSVSDESVLNVTADADASPGSLSVEVLRLAENHRMASGPKTAETVVGGTDGDKLEITVGEDTLAIDLSTAKTLAEIRDAINADLTGVDVSASLLTVDTDGDQRLTITARETGYDNRLQLAYGGTLQAEDFGFATLNTDEAGDPLTDLTRLDAGLSVDGFAVTRGSNRVDDVVDGLTFDLLAVGESSVNIAQNDIPIVQALTGLVDQYNALKSRIDELGLGQLSGDNLLRSITNSLRSAMNRSLSGFDDVSVISQLGVNTTDEGDLFLDTDQLTEALSGNRAAVAGFLSDENGFAAALTTTLNSFLDVDGILDTRTDGLNRQVADLQSQQARWADRLFDIEERYRKQFTELDSLVSQLLNTSNFLTQQLDNLPGSTFNQN